MVLQAVPKADGTDTSLKEMIVFDIPVRRCGPPGRFGSHILRPISRVF